LTNDARTNHPKLERPETKNRMKAYLITTGTVFGLITAAHIWRISLEGTQLAMDPIFILLTLMSVALCVWAFWLLKRVRRM
jgi:hypothetical protein